MGSIQNAKKVPRHPYMAINDWSNIHCDAYQSDTYTCTGPGNSENFARYPLPHEEEVSITLLFELQKGNIITVGHWTDNNVINYELLLIDKNNFNVLTSYQFSNKGAGLNLTGGYFYIDNKNRIVTAMNNTIYFIILDYGAPDTDGIFNPQFYEDPDEYSLTVSQGDIVSVLPDWYGNYWAVTSNGFVWVQNSFDSNPYVMELSGEEIANSIAIDETGGVFVVSDHAMYRFDYANLRDNNTYTWRESYDRGINTKFPKPGQFSIGSGTTPTLLDLDNAQYVAITDNAEPQMNIVVYRREADLDPSISRVVITQPVFEKFGCNENSLIGTAGSYIAENNYGNSVREYTEKTQTLPGLTMLSVSESKILWDNETIRIPSVVSKASIPDGLIYTYTLSVEEDGTNNWYFSTVDFATGTENSSVLLGQGEDYNNFYSGITLDPETGDALIPVVGGIVKIINEN
jgi:hypothetical protein